MTLFEIPREHYRMKSPAAAFACARFQRNSHNFKYA